MRFYLVRNAGRPAAIVPLRPANTALFGVPARQWELPRHLHMPLNDVLCSRHCAIERVLAAVGDALNEESGPWDVLAFDKVLDESPLSHDLTTAGKGVLTASRSTCDQLQCRGTYADMTGSFSRNFRSNLTKARNKLSRERSVRFHCAVDGTELEDCLDEFLALEASGWKGARGANTAIALHPRLVEFYRNVLADASRDGTAAVNCLRLEGRLIAAQLCLRDENTLYVLKLAYDETHARLAPGNMLLERVIKDALEQGTYEYINLVGSPRWFRDWRPETQPMRSLSVFGTTPTARLIATLGNLRRRIAPLYRKYLKSSLRHIGTTCRD